MNKKKIFSILSILLIFLQFILADEYKVPQHAYDLDVCDIDNDGDIDIVLGSNNQGNDTISILINDGYGNFSLSFLAKSNYSNIICSSIDEDDNPDIVALSRPDSGWVFYPNLGSSNFGNSQLIYKTSEKRIELYFINEDNSPDFISYDQGIGGGFGVLYNNGQGVFSDYDIYYATQSISEPAVGELNGDSLNDILLSDYDSGAFVFYNQGVGLFDQQSIDINPATHTYIFDINNDGYNDLGIYYEAFIGNGICRLNIFENQSDEFVFHDTIFFPTGTKFKAFADFNDDGFFDIVYKRSTWDETIDSLYVVFNNQDFTFSSPDRYFVNNPSTFKVVAADFDGNGYNDIGYTYYSSQDSITILFNDGTGKFLDNPLMSVELFARQTADVKVFPNPFSISTKIRIDNQQLIKNQNQFISICDFNGQIIKILPVPELNSAVNNYEISWDGKNNQGQECASGIYLLKCTLGNLKFFKKIVLIK